MLNPLFFLILWAVIFVLMVIVELASLQLTGIWFAIGAGGAFAAALAGKPFLFQLGVFVAVSFVLLLVTRPLLKKLRVRQEPQLNADRDIGQSAVIIQEINPALGTGRARIHGIDWMAVSERDEIIPEKTIVTVTRVEGAKLVVTPEYAIEESDWR